jgi:hypothetical protein
MTTDVAYVFYALMLGSKICNFMLRNLRLVRNFFKKKGKKLK